MLSWCHDGVSRELELSLLNFVLQAFVPIPQPVPCTKGPFCEYHSCAELSIPWQWLRFGGTRGEWRCWVWVTLPRAAWFLWWYHTKVLGALLCLWWVSDKERPHPMSPPALSVTPIWVPPNSWVKITLDRDTVSCCVLLCLVTTDRLDN